MATATELLRQGRKDEIWKKYCGFIDLSMEEFMRIQERLLLEQLQQMSQCELGRKLLDGRVVSSVEEFRKMVPLTTYGDYLPYLEEKREDVLPRKPYVWARTSGRSGEYEHKWVPYSREMYEKVGEFGTAAFILASCSTRGDIVLEEGDTCLYTLAPPPYFTGAIIARALLEQVGVTFIPSLEEGDEMDFQERIQEGFTIGLRKGIHLFYGLSSILVKVAEQLEHGSSGFKLSRDMLHPQLLARLTKGLIRSALRRERLLPKHLWKVKGIVAGGMDTAFYRDMVEVYWGRKPLEGYGGTELGGIALQAWNYSGMSFLPDGNFLEFIPKEDFFRSQSDPGYRPSTLLLNEVKPGVYELVISNFHGGVFTRYRTGDLVEIVSLRDEELDIDTPQMVFYARADGVIDIGGFTRLTEKAIWQAIEETRIPYVDWAARREYLEEKAILHLYIELKQKVGEKDVKALIHRKLKDQDAGYAELESMLGLDPLVVTLLPEGAFARYIERMRIAGAELAHTKPPHISPSHEIISRLLSV